MISDTKSGMIVLTMVSRMCGRPKKKLAFSVSEKFHREDLKKDHLQLDSKVIICGLGQQPGQNRNTCQDRASQDMFGESD